MTIEFFDLQTDIENFSGMHLKTFFDKIQKFIADQKTKIVKQGCYKSFGIIIEQNHNIYVKNLNVEHAIYSNEKKNFEFTKQ
ncbi:hypothetical protein GVAV_001090, partial [Gurleya vavrai]